MKAVCPLLGVSVAANIGLAWFAWIAPAPSTQPTMRASTASDAVTAVATTNRTLTGKETWQDIRDHDLATVARQLRDAGYPEYLVRAIVAAELDERFRPREEALAPRRPPLKYWQFDTYREPLETRLARLDLKREKARARLALLGPDSGSVEDSGIPAAKFEFARMISEDYDTMISEVRSGRWDMMLSVEKSALDELEADRQRELEALLTPEELSEYRFRTSPYLQSLRHELASFNATEQEFRAIHDLRLKFSERFNRGPPDFALRESETEPQRVERMRAASEARQAAERQLDEELRRTLGEERYRAYQRETDGNLHALRQLAERAGIPRENAERIHDLRDALAQESVRIGADSASSLEARQAALRSLAGNFRAQAQALLGAEATSAYLGNADWLRQVEQGNTITFVRNGWSSSPVGTPSPRAAQP